MKTQISILIFLFTTICITAQQGSSNRKVQTAVKGVHLVSLLQKNKKELRVVARVQLFKNNRVKKALSFDLTDENAKIA